MEMTEHEKKRLDRINELYAKSKGEGLSDAEKEEQKKLRSEYLADFRKGFKGILDNTYIKRPDGSKEQLTKKDK